MRSPFTLAKLSHKLLAWVILVLVGEAALIGGATWWILDQETARTALERQARSLRTAAVLMRKHYPNLLVEAEADGRITRLVIDELPEFADHAMIDEIGMVTRETVTVFRWDEQVRDFRRTTTNVIKDDGSRAVGTPLGQNSAVYSSMMRKETYTKQATALGKDYYTIYQPILDPAGKVVGILAVGVPTEDVRRALARVELGLLVAAAAALLAAAGGSLLVLRRQLRPLPALAGCMRRLAQDDLGVTVPYQERRDEIGDMAHAVQVFKDGAIERRRLEAEQRCQQEAREQRTRRVMQLTEAFDRDAAGVLEALGTASGEMHATSQAMAATAEQTRGQAGAVAAAGAQASANVQAVAAAAEELSCAIREIARQVGEASRISQEGSSQDLFGSVR